MSLVVAYKAVAYDENSSVYSTVNRYRNFELWGKNYDVSIEFDLNLFRHEFYAICKYGALFAINLNRNHFLIWKQWSTYNGFQVDKTKAGVVPLGASSSKRFQDPKEVLPGPGHYNTDQVRLLVVVVVFISSLQ